MSVNPYHPESLAYHLFESQRYQDQQAGMANRPLELPTNYRDWIGGMLVMGGLFGLVRGLVDHEPMGVVLMFAVRYALIGMAVVTLFYGVFLGPRTAFLAVRWAMRRSIVVKAMIIGAGITAAFGVWLSMTMHEAILRGVVRLGPIGVVLGFVVGGMISLARRSRRGAVAR
jgi:hypothetical protein